MLENFKFKILNKSENVYTNLNYAVFLYNRGDRQGASQRLISFRKHFENIVHGQAKDIDPELQEVSSKLGPILNLGDLAGKTKSSYSTETDSASASKSSQKYTNISNNTDLTGDAYNRESTVASVSNIGMNRENTRTNSATFNLNESLAMRKNFENS